MSPVTLERRHDAPADAWLDEHARAWVDAGLITAQQGVALHDYEQSHLTTEQPALLGPVAETAAFVGTVLALIGGAVGLGPQWGTMNIAVEIAIAGAIAVVGFVAGTWLVRLGEPATKRLGMFLWVLGTGGVALAAGTIANEIEPDSPWMAVAIGMPVAAIGAGLWRNLDRPLQLLTMAVGLGIGLAGFGSLLEIDPWVGGILVWLAGAGFWALTLTAEIRPEVIARCLASVVAMVGAFMLGDLNVHLGPAVALATAAVIILLALRLSATPVLVVGVLAALMSVQNLMVNTVHGPAGGAVVALVGLAIVVAIVFRTRGQSGAAS